ncbi:MAG TPA: MDR family MFS transporter, partial [Chloroflexota bacterium]|nr:MDR family MFS transporter [Chloroflexota bacterium]
MRAAPLTLGPRTPYPAPRAIAAGAAVATFLAGLDNAVVSTAIPTVVGQLGGLGLYAWVFSAYLLSSTASVPLYGKLADLYGRKRLFLVATTIFLVGSALCGQSRSMGELIVFRFVQGLGAGGLYPVTLIILGDLFPLEQRARLMGVLSAIWGGAAIIGPGVGGFLTEQVSWRWVFYVNLPLCLASMALVAWFLHERMERREHYVDYLGAVLLSGAVAALLLAVQSPGGSPMAGLAMVVGVPSAAAGMLLGALALVLGVVFVLRERRTPEPLLPLDLFRLPVISVGTASRFLFGVLLFGQASFVPPFIQGAMGFSPTLAGLVLAGTSLGWSIASNVSGRAILRWGYRVTGIGGAGTLVLGFVLLRLLSPYDGLAWAAVVQFVVGAGFGTITPVTLLSMQNAVDWGQRGVATSTSQLATNIGGTLGVTLAGALFASGMTAAAATGLDTSALLAPERRSLLDPL